MNTNNQIATHSLACSNRLNVHGMKHVPITSNIHYNVYFFQVISLLL